MQRLLTIFLLLSNFVISAQTIHDLGGFKRDNGQSYAPRLMFFDAAYVYHAQLKHIIPGSPTILERTLYRTSLDDFSTIIFDTVPANLASARYGGSQRTCMSSEIEAGNLHYILMSGGAFYTYNVATKAFTAKQSFSGTYSNGTGALIYDGSGLIYYWGGNGGSNSSWTVGNQLYTYNIANNLWSYLGNTPVSSDGMSGAYKYPFIYFSAGLTNHLYGGMYRFNTLDSSWTSIAGPVSGVPWYFQRGGDLVYNNNGVIKQLNCYDSNYGHYWKKSDLNLTTLSWSAVSNAAVSIINPRLGGNQTLGIYKDQTNTNYHEYRGYGYFISGIEKNFSIPSLNPGSAAVGRIHEGNFCQIIIDSTDCYSLYQDSIKVYYSIDLEGSLVNGNLYVYQHDTSYTQCVDTINSVTYSGSQSLSKNIQIKYNEGLSLSIDGTIKSANIYPLDSKIKLVTSPTLTANNSTLYCTGSQIGTIISSNLRNNSSFWQKRTNGNWVNLSQSPVSNLTVIDTGTYRYLFNNSNGCQSFSNVLTIAYIPDPTSTVSVSGSTTFCQGDSVVLSTSQSSGNSYQWKLNGNSISGATGNSFTAFSSGNYTVEVTNSAGCSATSSTISVAVNSLPTSTVSGSTTFCQGDSVVLSTSQSSGNSYQWKLNGNSISGATGNSFTAFSSGNYTVEVTNSAGCSATSSTISVAVLAPVINTSIIGQSTGVIPLSQYTYLVSNDTSLTYSWLANNGAIVAGQGTSSIDVIWNQVSGGTLSVNRSNGFCGVIDSLEILTTVNLVEQSTDINVYPNPTTGKIVIGNVNDLISYRLVDSSGKEVLEGITDGIIDIIDLPSGSYQLILQTQGGISTRPIQKL